MSPLSITILIICAFALILYLALMLYLYLGWMKLMSARNHSEVRTAPPYVSVIIPFRNEEKVIPALLNALNAQTLSRDCFELIMVDDGSADQGTQMIQTFAAENPDISITLLRLGEGEGSKKDALAAGIRQAGGQLIVCTDADVIPSKEWLNTIRLHFMRTGSVLILGPVRIGYGNRLFEKLQALEFLSLMASTAASVGNRHPIMANGANLAFIREAWISSRQNRTGKEYVSGDDVFMLFSVMQNNGPSAVTFVTNPSAMVSTHPSDSLSEFIQQRFRWVSKAPGYRDAAVMVTALIVLFYNFILLISPLAALAHPALLILLPLLWLMKCLGDYPLMRKASHYAGCRPLMRLFLLMELIYPFYVVWMSLGGLTGGFRWKERKYKNARSSGFEQ